MLKNIIEHSNTLSLEIGLIQKHIKVAIMLNDFLILHLPLKLCYVYMVIMQKRDKLFIIMIFRLPYEDIFGGVSAMTLEQFVNVNGFSNKYWGWGGEDDDMFSRSVQVYNSK